MGKSFTVKIISKLSKVTVKLLRKQAKFTENFIRRAIIIEVYIIV
jgi:hypothetical protein